MLRLSSTTYSYNLFTNNSDGAFYIRDVNNTANRLTIASTGAATFSSSVTATGFFESSDSKLKELLEDDIQVENIENLKAKLYIKNGRQEYGYFAQEAETYMPSAVTKSEDGYLNLSYREVHTAKISSLEHVVREQQAQIQELKELVNQLSSK